MSCLVGVLSADCALGHLMRAGGRTAWPDANTKSLCVRASDIPVPFSARSDISCVRADASLLRVRRSILRPAGSVRQVRSEGRARVRFADEASVVSPRANAFSQIFRDESSRITAGSAPRDVPRVVSLAQEPLSRIYLATLRCYTTLSSFPLVRSARSLEGELALLPLLRAHFTLFLGCMLHIDRKTPCFRVAEDAKAVLLDAMQILSEYGLLVASLAEEEERVDVVIAAFSRGDAGSVALLEAARNSSLALESGSDAAVRIPALRAVAARVKPGAQADGQQLLSELVRVRRLAAETDQRLERLAAKMRLKCQILERAAEFFRRRAAAPPFGGRGAMCGTRLMSTD
eukprot:gene261-359_t